MPETSASVTATLAGKKVAAEAVVDYVHAGADLIVSGRCAG
jgi:hypothetical protein